MPDSLPATIESDAFVGFFVQALCTTADRCKLTYLGEPYTSADRCIAHEVSHWAYHWERWTELLGDESAGVGWDGKKANACLQSIYLWDCKRTVDLRTWPTGPCEEAFVGAVNVGGQCFHDAQCTGGFCDTSTIKKEGCPGECKTWKGAGEICGVGARCGPGSWCRNGKCVKAPQGGGIVGDSCGEWPCSRGHWCTGTVESPGKCLPMPAKSEDCDPKVGCAEGLRCDGDTNKCVDGFAEDQPCPASGTPGGHVETCAKGYVCTTTIADYNAGEWEKGKCMKRQDGKDQWCDGIWQCGHADLYCKQSSDGGYCAHPPGEGEPCAPSSNKGECQPGLTCPGGKGNCKKPPTVGQGCDINQNFCASPYVCNGGKCAKVPGVGEPCLKDPKVAPCGQGATCVGGKCSLSGCGR